MTGRSHRSAAGPVPEDRVGKSHLRRDPSNSCLIPTLSGQSAATDERLESDVNLPLAMGLRYRHPDLRGLRRCGAGHRPYRGSGRHSDDPRSPEDKRGNLRTLPVTRKPGGAWSAVRLTPSSLFNPGCCALEVHGRILAGCWSGMVRTCRSRGGYRDGR